MSQTLKEQLSPNGAQRADSAVSELNSLASNGVVLCAPVLSNVQGDGKGDGYPEVKGKLSLGSAAFGANGAIFGWLLQADDGTNYESYITTSPSTNPPCPRPADFVWQVENATQAVIRDAWAAQGAPICANMKLLIWNATGVALAASGNSINLYYSTSQMI